MGSPDGYEDIDVGAHVLAAVSGTKIEESTIRALLKALDPEAQVAEKAPEVGIVAANEVRDLARSPIFHTDEALSLVSRFLNFHLMRMLRAAAESARKDGLTVIKLRHILPGCERWPYPLNRYC